MWLSAHSIFLSIVYSCACLLQAASSKPPTHKMILIGGSLPAVLYNTQCSSYLISHWKPLTAAAAFGIIIPHSQIVIVVSEPDQCSMLYLKCVMFENQWPHPSEKKKLKIALLMMFHVVSKCAMLKINDQSQVKIKL